jgi:hypothetical protein
VIRQTEDAVEPDSEARSGRADATDSQQSKCTRAPVSAAAAQLTFSGRNESSLGVRDSISRPLIE